MGKKKLKHILSEKNSQEFVKAVQQVRYEQFMVGMICETANFGKSSYKCP